MGDVKAIINAKIAGKKVMVFSKTHCPYCKMARDALKKHVGQEITKDDIEIWEIENEANCQKMQDELNKITGGRSVPRVFINGKFVGGGSEISGFEKSGQLGPMLEAE